MADLRGLVTTVTGWTLSEFDAQPLPAVFELLEYFSENPPTHLIQAAKAGLGRRRRVRKELDRPVGQKRKAESLKPVDGKFEATLPDWVRAARVLERQRIRNG
jgi:hypothetical protein